MTEQPSKSEYDIFPRDQLEHYKIELARLHSENEHLTDEVEYLRQALAATLSKIPQLEAPTPPASIESSNASSQPSQDWRQSLLQIFSMPYAGYFPLAPLIASPLVLLLLLFLSIFCGAVFFGVYFLVVF